MLILRVPDMRDGIPVKASQHRGAFTTSQPEHHARPRAWRSKAKASGGGCRIQCRGPDRSRHQSFGHVDERAALSSAELARRADRYGIRAVERKEFEYWGRDVTPTLQAWPVFLATGKREIEFGRSGMPHRYAAGIASGS